MYSYIDDLTNLFSSYSAFRGQRLSIGCRPVTASDRSAQNVWSPVPEPVRSSASLDELPIGPLPVIADDGRSQLLDYNDRRRLK